MQGYETPDRGEPAAGGDGKAAPTSGSLTGSSSLHGLARRTQDVDVIADIGPAQVRSLVQALQRDYYVDEQAWQDAVRRGFPYNVLHLGTMLKVDLIPL